MQLATEQNEGTESLVSCQNSQGLELRATLLKLNRFQAGFEVYGPMGVLRVSEVLNNFRILLQGQPVYAGRAVVSNIIQLGSVTVCEVTLDEACMDLSLVCPVNDLPALQTGFEGFLRDWAKSFKVYPDFKVVMADMQSLFLDLRLWMEQMELVVRSQPAADRLHMERDILMTLQKPVLPLAAPLLEKFEAVANDVQTELQPAHRAYMKRHIHPVVLCSPFLYRTFQKPLGYAGDYEMVNMMLRDPFEGGSMFAKVVNRIFLETPPVVAHQQRISYLNSRLVAEGFRKAARGQRLKVYNLGCGPARELQEFLSSQSLSDRTDLTLLDFNEETIAYTSGVLRDIKNRSGRAATIQMIKRSVHQILKDAGKPVAGDQYDLVYCAGLFDYLSDQVCKRLMNFLYGLVAPGGLLLSTNVSDSNPSRNWMEYVLDWHLIYRNSAQMAAFIPDAAPADYASVLAIGDGVNIALEVRRPEYDR